MIFCELQGAEICGMRILEITGIPDVSILVDTVDSVTDSDRYIRCAKDSFSRMLGDLHFAFRSFFRSDLLMQDLSAEFFWYAEPVTHQTYGARLRIFLVLRAISKTREDSAFVLSGMVSVCKSTLDANKYSFLEDDATYCRFYMDAVAKSACAVLKADRIENLQSVLLSRCYAYDRLPSNNRDMSTLVEMLLHSPGSAIMFQAIPTQLTESEIAYLEIMSNQLDTLNKGVHEMMIGNITNPVAERHAETYKYYEEQKHGALFHFNILVFATGADLYKLSGGINDFLCGNSLPGTLYLQTVPLGPVSFLQDMMCSAPWILNERIAALQYKQAPFCLNERFDVRRLSNIITADEAGGFLRLPIGGKSIAGGVPVNYVKRDHKNFRKGIIDAGDILVGNLKASVENQIGFRLKDINKHMLVVGTTGMGKTTFSVGLLDILWKQFSIPFLVIEPAKNEYRALIDSIPDIQIFTPGKDTVSPFVYNPFVPPRGVPLKVYKSVLKTAFAAGVTMTTPLDKIFEETVNRAYSRFGWLDSDTAETGGQIFNIADFAKEFERTFESLGYVGEARNVGRAGLVRLTSMIRLFDNYHSIPVEDLLSKPTIIELSGVPNKEDKALLIALLLLSVSSYIDSNYIGDGKLKNILLVEEAHCLLGISESDETGRAKPNAAAQELLKDMLAEKRSQGLGIIIADQSPEKVGIDIIKQTNIKLAFNLVEKRDKEILSAATNMAEEQMTRFTRLVEGEAFFFMNGMEEPEEVVTPNYRAYHDIRITIADDEVRERSSYWQTRKQKQMPYPECAICEHCMGECALSVRELSAEIANRIFAERFPKRGDQAKDSNEKEVLRTVLNTLRTEIKKHLRKGQRATPRLYFCIRMQFLRRIKYGTDIKLSDKYIKNNLKTAGQKE